MPSYNEEENIPLTYKKVKRHIDTEKFNYEIIFVNDGSSDETWNEIVKVANRDSRVRGINFSRNFGHQSALQAGLEDAAGDIIIMLDADLQHPPELFPELVKLHEKGFDIVNTVRKPSSDVNFFKKMTSRVFYKIMNSFSELDMHDGEADYRLISRKALDTLNALPESPKFYRGLVNWIGYDVARISYTAQDRMHGKSSYTLRKMFELARLGMTSFSLKPLKLIMTIGVCMTSVALVLLGLMVVVKFIINPELVSYNAILTALLLMVTGILTTFQGIAAMYLVDIFNTTKARPNYIVRERVGKLDEETTR